MLNKMYILGFLLLFTAASCLGGSYTPPAPGPGPASNAPEMDARTYLRRFIDERLGGDIAKLVDFNMMALENDATFGNRDNRTFDCDDTELTRAVFEVVWGGVLPGLKSGSIGTGRKWRGDTMNSFNTVFGKDDDGDGLFKGLEKYKPDEAMREKARKFNAAYHTIGNFTPLPNISVDHVTLNMFRAKEWNDFFDLFLIALHDEMANSSDRCPELVTHMRKNKWFFGTRNSEAAFVKFAKDSMWDDYLDAEGRPVKLFTRVCWWNFAENTRESYLQAAGSYADGATKIIRARGERIVEALKKKLAEPK